MFHAPKPLGLESMAMAQRSLCFIFKVYLRLRPSYFTLEDFLVWFSFHGLLNTRNSGCDFLKQVVPWRKKSDDSKNKEEKGWSSEEKRMFVILGGF